MKTFIDLLLTGVVMCVLFGLLAFGAYVGHNIGYQQGQLLILTNGTPTIEYVVTTNSSWRSVQK